MRVSAVALLCLLCSVPEVLAQTFKLTAVSPSVEDQTVTLFISTSGPPPTNVTDRDKWKVRVAQGDTALLLESTSPTSTETFPAIRFNKNTAQVEIDIPVQRLPTGISVATAGWQAGFFAPGVMSLAEKAEPQPPSLFKAAKNKDDADLYVLGAVIAGPNTKPIWMVDAKGSWGWPTGQLYHWFGVGGTFQINPGAKPPADSSDLSPDAITFFTQMDTLRARSLLGGYVSGYQAIARPFGGEYRHTSQAPR